MDVRAKVESKIRRRRDGWCGRQVVATQRNETTDVFKASCKLEIKESVLGSRVVSLALLQGAHTHRWGWVVAHPVPPGANQTNQPQHARRTPQPAGRLALLIDKRGLGGRWRPSRCRNQAEDTSTSLSYSCAGCAAWCTHSTSRCPTALRPRGCYRTRATARGRTKSQEVGTRRVSQSSETARTWTGACTRPATTSETRATSRSEKVWPLKCSRRACAA